MRRFWFLFSGLLLCVAGVAWAQQVPGEGTPLFTPYRQLGERRPQGIQYEPIYDRFAWVDLEGRLTLVDAATFQAEHILYEQGAYNAYRFSHDGRWLALAIDRRIELWNTDTGELSASFEPSGANLVQGPLHFTPDDHYLLLDTVVPAPQELRRSENDTSIIPWLWDLVAARGEAPSRYVSAEDGYAFFNFRNGLVVGANTTLIAGIPNRLQVVDGNRRDFPVTSNIQAQRAERDPIRVWQSASDGLLYVDPNLNRQIVQVNPETGDLFYITPGNDISSANIDSLQDFSLSNSAQVLCGGASSSETSLLRLIYGSGYLSYQNYEPLTITLLDVLSPMTMAQDQGALLLFSFNEQRGRGTIDLIRPPDSQQMVLSPDRTHLMIRRASGSQPIELYDLSTCTLERTITPTEPDEGGQHTLAYNATGDVIVSDFQRFDAHTGESLAHEVQYTRGFEQFTFSDDSRRIVTIRNNTWQTWDIETGQPLEAAPIVLRGEVLDRSPDASRYLTRTVNEDGSPTFEIVDIRSQARRTLDVPIGSGIEATYFSDDWEKVFVVYSPAPQSQHFPGNEIAVYQFGVGEVLRAAGDDLPPIEGRQYGWLDDRTVYIASYNTGYSEQPERVYGVNYDASGLPACLVEAYPDDYTLLLPVWDVLNYRLRSDSLAYLAQKLCAELPTNAESVIDALTPTPPFRYRSEATPLPYNIPGVPECLTSRFATSAIDYAGLWREITADLDETQTAEIETMICEGLITSVGGIQATPTINPNLNVPPTPTPIDASPETTTGSDTYRIVVYAIDLETQQRTQGDYLPPLPTNAALDLSIVNNFYNEQFHHGSNQLAVSPDGQLAAEFDGNNFIRIYRLSRSYAALMDDEANAVATRAAQSVHSIGLLPTPTDSFSGLGEIRPTLTPTLLPTAPPLAQATPNGWDETQTEDVCPASHLYTVDNPPPDFEVSGRLFARPGAQSNAVWVLDPVTGRVYADPTIPACVLNGTCRYSYDLKWMVRDDNGVIVSHLDGSAATELIPPGQTLFMPTDYKWQPDNTLIYSYHGYLATAFPGRSTLLRSFNPETGSLSEPFLPAEPFSIDGLPTSIASVQPGGSLVLASTPFGVTGARYYIYDRATGIATYFARTNSGGLLEFWHPLGDALYYTVDGRDYVFDTTTRTHHLLPGGVPNGNWSRDARYSVAAFVDDSTHVNWNRIQNGELPFKVDITDNETGAHRRYCIPETGYSEISQTMFWSPDNRYLAFTTTLPLQGDYFPTPGPTAVPYTPQPTITAVPLEVQYDYQFPRTLVLDTQTGYVTIISTEIQQLILWADEGGAS